MSRDDFVTRYGSAYEHSPWVAERAYDGGADLAEDPAPLLRRVVERAGRAAQLELLRAHPDLANRLGKALTPASAAEQEGAGLDRCTPEEFDEFQALNRRYTEKFGFPFIIAVRGHDRRSILAAFRDRVDGSPEREFRAALDEVHKIAAFRLVGDVRPAPERIEISLQELHGLTERALKNAGADDENAEAIAATVMAAERDGSESHGVFRLPGYAERIEAGGVNGHARPTIVEAKGGVVIADGDGGAAPRLYAVALPVLAERAAEEGVAVLAARNAVHFAAMWHEVEWLADRGLSAFACTANFPYVAPHGASKPFFGTNPIAFAYPARPSPVAFDFAASTIARGDVMIAARDGRSVPLGVGIDSDGIPTTDPSQVLQGAMLPFAGHKGSAIALMVELLAAATVGEKFSDEADPEDLRSGLPRGGIFILAISPERLGGKGALERASAWLGRLAAQPGARVPGWRRHQGRAAATTTRVPAKLLETIRTLAGS